MTTADIGDNLLDFWSNGAEAIAHLVIADAGEAGDEVGFDDNFKFARHGFVEMNHAFGDSLRRVVTIVRAFVGGYLLESGIDGSDDRQLLRHVLSDLPMQAMNVARAVVVEA